MTVEQTFCGRTLRYRPLTAQTRDGLSISVQDHGGSQTGHDILFIHGFSQSSLAWLKQVTGPLRDAHRLVTYDLRGHGASDKPSCADFYRDPARWADEVRAVIAAAELDRPIIVCWSYAGRIALDFLGQVGGQAISGLVKVASTSCATAAVLGPATAKLRAMTSATDLAENIAAVQGLLDASTVAPLPADERALMLGYNLLTPVCVRLAMSGREADYAEVLRSLDVPLLAIHGAQDQVNLPAMSAYSVAHAQRAACHIYEESGHLPFWEESGRFDRDLRRFADSIPRGTAII